MSSSVSLKFKRRTIEDIVTSKNLKIQFKNGKEHVRSRTKNNSLVGNHNPLKKVVPFDQALSHRENGNKQPYSSRNYNTHHNEGNRESSEYTISMGQSSNKLISQKTPFVELPLLDLVKLANHLNEIIQAFAQIPCANETNYS